MGQPKSKAYYILIGLFVTLFVLYVVVEIMAPEEVKWEDSFAKDDKSPYGAYVLYQNLSALFPQSKIKDQKVPLYKLSLMDTLEGYTNYIFINNQFAPDIISFYDLLDQIYSGDQALIVANRFSPEIEDTLGITTEFEFGSVLTSRNDSGSMISQRVDTIRFVNPQIADSNKYFFTSQQMHIYFSEIDSSNTHILAVNQKGLANLIRIQIGSGSLLVGTSPHAFTNEHILYQEHASYVTHCLSYLPIENRIYWDEYYKVKHLQQIENARTPLSYIHSQQALSWAFYIILFSLLTYMVFFSKRMQRIIPVIKALPNSTLIFTETIGRLYFQSADHKNIAEKKIKIFLSYIRKKYFLTAEIFSEEFIQKLAAKSGVPQSDVVYLFKRIEMIRYMHSLTENELIEINDQIEAFYAIAGRK